MRPQRWFTRRLPAIGAALAAVTAMTGVLTPSASASVSANANYIFNVGYANIKRDITNDDQFRTALRSVTDHAAIVGLGEVAGRTAWLRNWAQNNNWHFYAPTSWGRDNAVLAKESMFRLVATGSQFNCDSNGDQLPHPRYTNWVRYEHRQSGRTVFHLNTHLNPHIELDGAPRANDRLACAEEHIREIKALASEKKQHGQVIVTGDMNIDFSADKSRQYANFPYVVLEERGEPGNLPALRSCYALYGEEGTGTHADRHIDYIYFWKRIESERLMWMTDYHLAAATASDHRGVLARFEIAP